MAEEVSKGSASEFDVDFPPENEPAEPAPATVIVKSVPPPVPSRPPSAPPLRASLPQADGNPRPSSIPPPLPAILPGPPKASGEAVRVMRIIRIESSGQSLPPPPAARTIEPPVEVPPMDLDLDSLTDSIDIEEQLNAELEAAELEAVQARSPNLEPRFDLEPPVIHDPIDPQTGFTEPLDFGGRPAPNEVEDLSGEALVLDSAPTNPVPVSPALESPAVAAPASMPAVSAEDASPSRRNPPPRKRRSQTPAPSAKALEKALHPPRSDASAKKKNRVWWENLFTEDFARAILPLGEEQVRAEVDFIERSLAVTKDGVILDLACGTGHHAVEYARRGYTVIGYDLSVSQLAEASELAQEQNLKMNFLQGDMREMAFENKFDGIYCWNTSFGYFEEEKNIAVAKHIFRALKSGGHLLLDVMNRDFAVAQQPSQNWFEGDTCVCMDDMSVDFITSRLRVKRTIMLDDGRTNECAYSIRLYGLHELGKVLHDIGFKVIQASGQPSVPGVFLGAYSPRVIILASKP